MSVLKNMIPSLAKLSLQCQEVGADYDPAEGGNDDLQFYFTDMLLDSDRNAKYFAAIKSCVEDFVKNEGRPAEFRSMASECGAYAHAWGARCMACMRRGVTRSP